MIKPTLFKKSMLLALLAGLTLFACESNDPEPELVVEEITSVLIEFIAPDGSTFTFEGANGTASNQIRLKENLEYEVVVTLRIGSEDVTKNIADVADQYQLFMIDGGDARTIFRPQDAVGLKATLNSGPEADCKLNIILAEGLDKESTVAKGNVREGTGGVDRFFLQSDLFIQ